jgi:hypothetical protein
MSDPYESVDYMLHLGILFLVFMSMCLLHNTRFIFSTYIVQYFRLLLPNKLKVVVALKKVGKDRVNIYMLLKKTKSLIYDVMHQKFVF